MLGTGWRCLDIIHMLEEDLQVPVVHAVPARVWPVQKRLHLRQKVKGSAGYWKRCRRILGDRRSPRGFQFV